MLQSSSSEKNMVHKPSKNEYFCTQFGQIRGQCRPHPKRKTIFWAEITKADHQLSETFNCIKIPYVLAEI